MTNNRIHYLETEKHKADIHVEIKRPKGAGLLQFGFSVMQKIAPKWSAEKAFSLFITPMRRAKHSFEDELLKEVIRHETIFDNKKIRVYEWKGGDRKAVLAHGWESRATALRTVVPQLRERGFTVYAVDAPAHGESEGKQTNVIEYAHLIGQVAREFGGFDIAVAHSFGGLALSYALVEIPGFRVPNVILAGLPASTKLALQGMYRFLHLERPVQELIEKKIYESTNYSADELSVAHLATKFQNVNGLLFHDEKDNLVPLYTAIDSVNAWQSSTLYVTHGLGHFRVIKSKEVLMTMFDWVDHHFSQPKAF